MHFPWLGFIFWVGLFTWFAVVVWTRYLREREKQQTLRYLAERGAAMDAQTLEKLFPKAHEWAPPARRRASAESVAKGIAVAGVIILFAGLGLLAGAQVIGRIEEEALYGMSAGGVVVSFIGMGLFTSSLVLRRRGSDASASHPVPDDAR